MQSEVVYSLNTNVEASFAHHVNHLDFSQLSKICDNICGGDVVRMYAHP